MKQLQLYSYRYKIETALEQWRSFSQRNHTPSVIVVHPQTWFLVYKEYEHLMGDTPIISLMYSGINIRTSLDVKPGIFEIY